MNYPRFVEIEGKQFKINTDFRVAIECNRIATDESIGDLERALAIIYLLYGDEGLNDSEKHNKLLELGLVFLSCDSDIIKEDENKEADMDFIQDMDYIEASFMSDYKIDLENTKMHWWKFNKLINGLSNSELGNCCVLNMVRNLRNFDVSQIKDEKERKRIIKAKEQVALKKPPKVFTEEQQNSIDKFNKLAGL